MTHDQEEAFEVADRVVVMNKGKVEQDGTPIEVFEHPANAFVMDFLGNVNKLPVRVEGGRALLGETGTVELPAQMFVGGADGRTDAYIRPHELDIARTAEGGNCLLGKIVHINPAGSVVKVRLLAEDFGLMINVDITPDRYRASRSSRTRPCSSPRRALASSRPTTPSEPLLAAAILSAKLAKLANLGSKLASWPTWTKCLKSCCFLSKLAKLAKLATHTPPAARRRTSSLHHRTTLDKPTACPKHFLAHNFNS